MAIKSSVGKKFSSKKCKDLGIATESLNLYGVVDSIEYSKRAKVAYFRLEVYLSEAVRNTAGSKHLDYKAFLLSSSYNIPI